jgi:hypothetical protein
MIPNGATYKLVTKVNKIERGWLVNIGALSVIACDVPLRQPIETMKSSTRGNLHLKITT